jgi:hypothetical protein
MDASFEAFVREDVDLVTHQASVRVRHGLYIVSVKHNQRGGPDGARLTRIEFEKPFIRLTQAQYELLDQSRCFERH